MMLSLSGRDCLGRARCRTRLHRRLCEGSGLPHRPKLRPSARADRPERANDQRECDRPYLELLRRCVPGLRLPGRIPGPPGRTGRHLDRMAPCREVSRQCGEASRPDLQHQLSTERLSLLGDGDVYDDQEWSGASNTIEPEPPTDACFIPDADIVTEKTFSLIFDDVNHGNAVLRITWRPMMTAIEGTSST